MYITRKIVNIGSVQKSGEISWNCTLPQASQLLRWISVSLWHFVFQLHCLGHKELAEKKLKPWRFESPSDVCWWYVFLQSLKWNNAKNMCKHYLCYGICYFFSFGMFWCVFRAPNKLISLDFFPRCMGITGTPIQVAACVLLLVERDLWRPQKDGFLVHAARKN